MPTSLLKKLKNLSKKLLILPSLTKSTSNQLQSSSEVIYRKNLALPTQSLDNRAKLKKNRATFLASISYEEVQQKNTMSPPKRRDKGKPHHDLPKQQRRQSPRARRVGDELANQALSRGQRPSRRAKMANALRVERLLKIGRFKSVRELAMRTGISRNTREELLEMLNQGVKEIEKVLFETGER